MNETPGRSRVRSREHIGGGPALALALAAALAGCKQPAVGSATAAQESRGPEVAFVSASVDASDRVVARFTLSLDGSPIAPADAAALRPTFTLAFLSVHPVDGLATWESLLLTGSQTIPSLPPGGPGTPPAAVQTNVKQPGSESSGTLAANPITGEFTYTFANALPPGFDRAGTFRVGVYLEEAEGTPRTSATHDFVPSGGVPAERETTLDANCHACHGSLQMHEGRRSGVKLCLTCHTWQAADPDTVDPAAADGSTAATDPNPLDLGRLVHRIHRGVNLPTLYQASSTAAASPLPPAAAPPLPFFPGRNTAVLGRKYSVVGFRSQEHVYGRIVSRTDNYQPGRTVASGVVFPRDLRDCAACHAGAPQEQEVVNAISRRTCSGCHPEIWFEPSSIPDAVHFAHTGGPRTDDVECAGCHVAATASQPKVWAPIAEAHVPPVKSPRYSKPVLEIVRVTGLVPGGAPTVVFKLSDRAGVLSPPNAPVPANDTFFPTSPVPRAISSLTIRIAGPASDYGGPPSLPISSGGTNPSPLTLVADPGTGEFTYTFVSTIPADATGTWAVGMEGRRRATTRYYDVAAESFPWPFTGEQVTESPDNPVVWVDVATGTYPSATAVPRRKVVSQEKCAKCHLRFELHGSQRHEVEYCLLCHSPSLTDWARRPKVSGNVNLGATYDGIEERSVHFKVMVHRIHTGGRSGPAALDALAPHVIYGFGSTPFFFDEGIFPNDLANCTLCHEGKSYLVESVPGDAAPTVANETATIRHSATSTHASGEPSTLPIQAACASCHATGATFSHASRYTVAGKETCAQCHGKGANGVEEAHGLVAPARGSVSASFSSIVQNVIVPRCASAACHGGNPPAFYPQLDAEVAWDALVGRPSLQASMALVEPGAPEASYLLLKLKNEAGSAGGVPTPMPIGDALLDPGEIAAVEAWIAAGAPND